MRKGLTWGVVGVVGLIATLASVDALREGAASRPEPFARAQETTPPTRTKGPRQPIPTMVRSRPARRSRSRCGQGPRRLARAGAVQRVRGAVSDAQAPDSHCFFDERGVNEIAATAGIQEAFAPTVLWPDVDLTVGFNVIDRCGGGKPRTYVVEGDSTSPGLACRKDR